MGSAVSQWIGWLDLAACIGLACAAAFRAAELGAQYAGAVVLGFFCGLAGPLGRDILLQGADGARLVVAQLPAYALTGALIGVLLCRFSRKSPKKVFNWLDGFGLGLGCCLGATLGMAEGGLGAAFLCAGAGGLAPGVFRDIALGDTAMFLDEPWYAAAAILGVVVTLAVLVGGIFALAAPEEWRLAEAGCLLGTAAVFVLRVWKTV